MTFKFNNVYVGETSTVVGPIEKAGPLKKYFDKSYKDFYFGEASFEKAEVKLVKDALNILLKKINKEKRAVDIVIGGDLENQIAASTYGTCGYGQGYLGIYGACSSSVEGMIVGSSLIDSGKIKDAIVEVSSHNLASEKQFRNPSEYGAPKPHSATFTATGGAAIYLTKEKTNIKVESATIGKIIDYGQNDPNDMGKVMAPSAIDTIRMHLKDLNRTTDYYDLIVTGDLGYFGKAIVIDYLMTVDNIDLTHNYNDCGIMLYDLKKQEQVLAGGSGPVCSALVTFSYIYDMLRTKKLKKVLVVATGALFSPTLLYQKEDINSIAQAISLEAL